MGRAAHAEEGLHRIDLNLLVALDALTRERSVTKAAARAGVTQSAMSHTLRRLRELFDDPLLVRGRGGMVLTPRAEALAVPLRSGLVSLARTLAEPQPFEPEHASRTFRVVSPDLFDALVLPTLLQRLDRQAPLIDLAVVPAPKRLADSLETGVVDRILHAQGLQRRIALRVPQFASALEVIAQSDLVLTAPSRLSNCSAASTLASRPAPLDIPEHGPAYHTASALRPIRSG